MYPSSLANPSTAKPMEDRMMRKMITMVALVSLTFVAAETLAQGQGRGQGRGGQGQGQNKNVGQGRGRGMGQGRGRGMGEGKGMKQGQGRGGCDCMGKGKGGEHPDPAKLIATLPKGKLNTAEINGLLLMREEEKLAHDVYVTLGKKWPKVRPFTNIPHAESRHMKAVKALLDRYDLEDPVKKASKVGKFQSKSMQKLYDALVEKGKTSVEDAIQVGAEIEELDIADLRKLMKKTDNKDIRIVYQNLLKGSRNHLRAFSRHLERYDVEYEAKHLSQKEFDRIAASDHERGKVIMDPNFKFGGKKGKK